MEPKKIERENYTVHVGYSDEAVEKKLLKFILKTGSEFEISADDLASMISGGVNSDVLEAAFVETDRINVVEVDRQLECMLEKDMKKGDKIRINYKHPYPVEFAIIEEAYGIAKIKMDLPVMTLTKEFLDSVRSQIKPRQEKFIKRFYEIFKNVVFKKK